MLNEIKFIRVNRYENRVLVNGERVGNIVLRLVPADTDEKSGYFFVDGGEQVFLHKYESFARKQINLAFNRS